MGNKHFLVVEAYIQQLSRNMFGCISNVCSFSKYSFRTDLSLDDLGSNMRLDLFTYDEIDLFKV